MACIMRDVEFYETTQKIMTLRVGPIRAAWVEVLSAGLDPKQRAMLPLALNFYTWRALTRDGGLTQEQAVDTMVESVIGAG
jgi:hypothetical protein